MNDIFSLTPSTLCISSIVSNVSRCLIRSVNQYCY